jgi:hypothetical protein
MSANNYMSIIKVGDNVYVWDNLNAEEAIENEILTLQNADKVFNSLEEAIEWANKNNETEYGYQVNNFHKPKDGYKEKFNFHE